MGGIKLRRMKNIILSLLFVLAILLKGNAQKQTYDLTSYIPPAGWTKTINDGVISYSISDDKTKSWGVINVIKSNQSKGRIDDDFDSEWSRLVTTPFNITAKPTYGPTADAEGWKLKAGGCHAQFNDQETTFMLVTYSGFEHCASILAIANNRDYVKTIQDFLGTVQITKTATTGNSTTNWDNGWTSVAKEDWVEVSKGNIKVLLHYPNPVTTKYYANSDEEIAAVWNNLVAPRYSNLTDFKKWFNLSNIPRPLLAGGYLQDNATGKIVYVSIYHRGPSNLEWIEVISPDKNSFVQNFGIDISTMPNAYTDPAKFNALDLMIGYNRFAVTMEDLTGSWTNNYSSSLNYYNNSTGLKTDTRTYASSQVYSINANGSYRWELNTAESSGSTKFQQTVSTGTCRLISNWEISFSDIGKKPKTYNVYFSSIKNGRLLWLQDKEYGAYNSFGRMKDKN